MKVGLDPSPDERFNSRSGQNPSSPATQGPEFRCLELDATWDSTDCLVEWLPIPCSLSFYDASASSVGGACRSAPFRGPRLRALITLIRSSNSCDEQCFFASSASAA